LIQISSKTLPLNWPIIIILNILIRNVEVDMARFQATEGLFNPEIWGLDGLGIHKLIVKAIQSCSMDLRREMAKNIYLAGMYYFLY
jgi:hypothetical protein